MKVTETNIDLMRGDKDALVFTITGKHDDRKIYFTVKESRELEAEEVVLKRSVSAGGVSGEISCTYTAALNQTVITVNLVPSDTYDLAATINGRNQGKYNYDLVSVHASTADDSVTVAIGAIRLQADVRTPFDGSALPGSVKRLVMVPCYKGTTSEMNAVALTLSTDDMALFINEDESTFYVWVNGAFE